MEASKNVWKTENVDYPQCMFKPTTFFDFSESFIHFIEQYKLDDL